MTIRFVNSDPIVGFDTNPGTQSQPFRTITKGLSVSFAGDILYLRQGNYTEVINSVPSGSSYANTFTLASYTNEIATIFNLSATAINIQDNSATQYVIIDRLVINANNGTNNPVGSPTSTQHGIYLGTTTNHISITNCEIKNQPGMAFRDRGSHNEIRDCNINNNYNHGAYMSGTFSVADNNLIQNNGGAGVYVFDQGSISVNSNIVRNNRCYNNGLIYKQNNGVPNYFLTTGVWLSSGTGNIAYNNIIANHAGAAGLYIVTNATNTECYNNTIYQCELQSIVLGASSSGAIVKNNLCYLNGSDPILNTGTNTTLATNLTGVNPLFVNVAANNFSVQNQSPTIDQGTTIELVTTAINGIGRPQGNAYDIGAYEYFIVSPGNALWWTFEETTGNTVADSSGLGNTGTFINNPSRITGVSGPYAILFNGSSNYIENTTFSWPITDTVTVLFWVNTPGGTNAVAFNVGSASGNRFTSHCPYSDNVLYWDYGDISNNGRIQIDFTPYLNIWTHIGLVAGGNFKGIYINGILVTSLPVNNFPQVALTGVRLGGGIINPVTYYHNGSLDDFQIYNRVLSQGEILGATHRTPPSRSVYIPQVKPILAF